MNAGNKFKDFNRTIRLDQAKRDNLKKHRKALRERIRDYFAEKEWQTPSFASQGSFPLKTNVNPIRVTDNNGNWIEEYDLDDGVYFICAETDRESGKTYHGRVLEAVTGHTKSCEAKPSCVRVIYSDGHHVDMPIYWASEDGATPQIGRANQGYTDSDPKAFKDWVEAKIASTSNVGQLRRIIRYLKAWKNYQELEDSTLRLPPGVTLTILACNNLVENESDDTAFRETMRKIHNKLEFDFTCYRPTTPTNEDLLAGFAQNPVISAFSHALDCADAADKHITIKDTCDAWREVFGNRFPLGEEENKASGGQQQFSTRNPKTESLNNARKLLDSGTARTAGTGVIGTTGISNLPHKFYADEEVHSD